VAGSRDPQPGGVGRHNEAHWFAALGAVHDAGGFILAQLVACALPGAPLDLPRPLDLIDDYRRAALEARRAGFDGVELNLVGARPLAHLPQPDRIALLLDVLDGLIADWAADRVGLRLCHGRDGLGRNDVSPLDLCEAVLRAVNERQVAYVHLAGRGACPGPALYGAAGARRLRTAIAWPLLVSGPFTPLAGLAAVESRWADAVGFESVEDALPLLAALRSAAGEG
jgi:2,4-dienoyl-CoA reductase-like NADH-dependent reductase (Old Yellow Enzyme family)